MLVSQSGMSPEEIVEAAGPRDRLLQRRDVADPVRLVPDVQIRLLATRRVADARQRRNGSRQVPARSEVDTRQIAGVAEHPEDIGARGVTGRDIRQRASPRVGVLVVDIEVVLRMKRRGGAVVLVGARRATLVTGAAGTRPNPPPEAVESAVSWAQLVNRAWCPLDVAPIEAGRVAAVDVLASERGSRSRRVHLHRRGIRHPSSRR